MRGLQPMHHLEGMPEGRPGADPGGTGFASAGTPAEHRMMGVTQVGQASWPVHLRAALGCTRRTLMPLLLLLAFLPTLGAQAIPYSRPVDTAPQAEAIGGGYKTPAVQKPLPRDAVFQVMDVLLLAAAMGVSVWLVLKRRSRKWAVALTIGSLAYFGFYREGCVCPIGSIQNVAVALTDRTYAIPMVVTATFLVPLVVALFFGRAFCGGVCALGAIQELVVLKPVRVPERLDRALGLLKYVYLGLAILLAIKPALGRDFLICLFDPFVGFFRRTGAPHMLLLGGGFLLLGLFVERFVRRCFETSYDPFYLQGKGWGERPGGSVSCRLLIIGQIEFYDFCERKPADLPKLMVGCFFSLDSDI